MVDCHGKIRRRIELKISAVGAPRKGYAQKRAKLFRKKCTAKRFGAKTSESFPRWARHEKVERKNEQNFSARTAQRKGSVRKRMRVFRGGRATKRLSIKTSESFPLWVRHGKVGRKNEQNFSAGRPPRKGYAQNRAKVFRGTHATKRLRTKTNKTFPLEPHNEKVRCENE